MYLRQGPPTIVDFRGTRAASGPLTLGQVNIHLWLSSAPEHRYACLEWWFDIPEGTCVDDVAQSFAVLLTRHEGLRTRYAGGNPPTQHVLDTGQLAIETHLVDGDAAVDTGQLAAELSSRLNDGDPPGSGGALPLRVALAARGDTVLACVARYSHLAVDFQAMAVIAREFAELVRDPATRVPGAPRHQPLDQAAAEAGTEMRARMRATLRYWEQHLRQTPRHMYVGAPGGQPGCGAAVLTSPAGGLALQHITARTQASKPTAVLAALCAALGARTGYRTCRFPILSGNRFGPQLENYVGTLVQAALFSLDLTGASFDRLVQRTFAGILNAGKYGIYDVSRTVEIQERLERERGLTFSLEPVFNNLVVDLGPPAPDPPPTVESVAAALPRTDLSWEPLPVTPAPPLGFELWRVDQVLRLRLVSGDLSRAGRDELESLLLAVERLLVAAAAGDLAEDAIWRAVDLEPLPRGPGWVRVDSCWVDLAEVTRVAQQALAPAQVRVIDTDDDRLVAYLYGDSDLGTPEQAHERCLAAVRGHVAAMTPRRYVRCASAPDDPADEALWRKQPVLWAGSGRPDPPAQPDPPA